MNGPGRAPEGTAGGHRGDEGWAERLLAVATLGAQRRPGPDRPWTSALGIEQELLVAVDAALDATDPAALIRRVEEASAGNLGASAAFARALLLGSAPGEAPARAAARTLRDARPDARPACADALVLARSPDVGPALAGLLADAPPPVLAAALGVLRARRQVPYPWAALLLAHPDAGVAAAAARALWAVPERHAAADVLRARLARGAPADTLALAAAEALLVIGDPAGLAFVRARLAAESSAPSLADDARVAYLRLLALGGDASDLELFFQSVEPAARDAAAVGWFGHPDLVEWLLGSLEAANDARRARGPGAGPAAFEVAAARALGRILGDPSHDGGFAPKPPPQALRSAPAEGGSQVDAAPWRAFWGGARAELGRYPRLRFGRPYTPAATLDELEAAAPAAARADAALELAIVSRGASLLETDDWVARQRAVLSAARAAMG